MNLAVITLEGGALTVVIAAVGSFIGIKVALATHAASIKSNSEKIGDMKEDNKAIEERVRAVENKNTEHSTEVKSIFKAVEKLGDKIDEIS